MLGAQFLISVYGGYFGAGIGILMLAVLQFAPLKNIHEMNAVKVVLGTAINAVAFLTFALSGNVDWSIGKWMLIGGILGGYFGTRISLHISPLWMRRFVNQRVIFMAQQSVARAINKKIIIMVRNSAQNCGFAAGIPFYNQGL